MNNTEQNILKEKIAKIVDKLYMGRNWLSDITRDDVIKMVNKGYQLTQKETAEKVEKLKEVIEFLNVELFLTDIENLEIGKREEMPDDIRIILEGYTNYLQGILNREVNKIFNDNTKKEAEK